MNVRILIIAITLLFSAAPSASAQTVQRFSIDTAQSAIRIITDKKGIAAAAAHQHVVSIKNISGKITYLQGDPSNAQLSFKPAEFLVDDPAERALYPDIFKKPVSDKTIRGTIKNMLGAKLLNVATYPEISVALTLAESNDSGAVFDALVSIQDRKVAMKIPGTLSIEDGTLRAKASFESSNQVFGLAIFKAMLGSISVGHVLKFDVDIVATQQVE